MSEYLELRDDERTAFYAHHDTLGWFPVPGSEGVFEVTNQIYVSHNERGFRDEEHLVKDTQRMIVIGDSFVWGFNVEQPDRFTEHLDSLLPGWVNYNLGVSGYGTDQEYLILHKHIEFYKPDVVLLVYCTDNDKLDTTTNFRYRGYYKSYFEENEFGELELKGVPVPKGYRYHVKANKKLYSSYLIRLISKRYHERRYAVVKLQKDPTFEILEKMNALSEKNESRFIVGLQKQDALLESFLQSQQIEFLILENEEVFPFAGNHWTPKGHQIVAQRIRDYLE